MNNKPKDPIQRESFNNNDYDTFEAMTRLNKLVGRHIIIVTLDEDSILTKHLMGDSFEWWEMN